MKAVRLFSIVMAVALFTVAFVPFAAKPIAVQSGQTVLATSPVQAFMDSASGMPLLAPMSVAVPFVTISVEGNAATSGYACTLVKQSPKDYTKMKTRQYFDVKWTVQNTGDHIWYANWVPFKYMGGTKMQTHGDVFSLSSDVGRGKKIRLVVDMEAPKTQGIYSTTWGLYSGKSAFCRVTLTVGVSQ